MTEQQERLLFETHSDTREIVGILNGGNGGGVIKDVQDNSDNIEHIKKHMVTKTDCKEHRKSSITARWNAWKVVSTIIPWIGMLAMIYIALKSLGG